jgi:hypothetical protein
MPAAVQTQPLYDLSRFDRSARTAEAEVAKPRTAAKAAVSRKSAISGFSVFSAIVTFVMLAAVLFSYVSLTEASDKNRKSYKELESIREEIQMLEISKNQRMGAMQVRDWAVTKLGMSKIDKSQITYVSTTSGDRVEIVSEEKRETPRFVTGLINGFSTIVEFVN